MKQRSLGRTIDAVARISLVFAALLMLAVAIYAWWDGHLLSPVRIILFAILPTAFACVTAYAVFASASRRWLIIMNLTAVALTFVAFELYLRVKEERAGPEQAQKVRKSHPDYLPQTCSVSVPGTGLILPGGDTVIPLGGISRREIFWKGYTLWTDRYGFKNPDSVWDAPGGAILFTGDSFTYGSNARPEGGFVELLRKRGFPTINLGCGGNGPLAELGTVAEYAPLAKPGWIIWVYYEGNDLTKDIGRESNFPLFTSYLDSDARQNLASKQKGIDTALLDHIGKRRKIARRQESRLPEKKPSILSDWRGIIQLTYIRRNMGLNYGYQPRALKTFSRVLDSTASIAARLNAKLMFVYLPGKDRYGTFFGATDAGGYGTAVKQRAKEAGFAVVDIDSAFWQTGRDPQSFYNGHYTDEGHAIVADAIEDALRK